MFDAFGFKLVNFFLLLAFIKTPNYNVYKKAGIAQW